MFPSQRSRTAAFRNEGEMQFKDVAAEWGFTEPGISHGSCLADLDGDGDLDLIMNNLESACAVYRNDAPAGRVAVRLEGSGRNRNGIGAKISLRSGSTAQQQEMISGGRYLSSDAPERVFALGVNLTGTIEVRWRNGRKKVIENVQANHRYVITEEGR